MDAVFGKEHFRTEISWNAHQRPFSDTNTGAESSMVVYMTSCCSTPRVTSGSGIPFICHTMTSYIKTFYIVSLSLKQDADIP